MPIRVRMALLGVGVIALTLVLFSVLIYALLSRGMERDQAEALQRRAEQTVDFLADAGPESFRAQRVPAALDLRESVDVFVTVLGGEDQPLSSTGEIDGAAPAVPSDVLAAAARDGSATATVAAAPEVRLRVDVRPWRRPDLGLAGYVVAGQSLRHNQRQQSGVAVFLIVSAVVSLGVAAAAIWFMLGRALRPLRTVARTADEIARTEDLGRRLPPVQTRDEVGALSASFNGMLDRVQAAYARLSEALASQQRFVADASHELRTPLTTIRTNAAFLQRPDVPAAEREAALRDIAGEGERMSRLVHDLLTLARADAGGTLEMAPVDLAAVAREVCRRARGLHPARRIEAAGDEALVVQGNADALERMLWILVDNAVKHTPVDGRVRVWPACRNGAVQVKVVDDGTGIPEVELERIFDRFYQVDAARGEGGAGLGLAIARWIAREHGGTLTAYNNDGGGATFLFELPAASGCAATPPPA